MVRELLGKEKIVTRKSSGIKIANTSPNQYWKLEYKGRIPSDFSEKTVFHLNSSIQQSYQ